MKTKHVKLVVVTFLMALTALMLLLRGNVSKASTDSDSGKLVSMGRGTVEELEIGYKEWEAQYESYGGDRNLVLPVGPFKGLVTEYLNADGSSRFDLIDGKVHAEVKGLSKSESWDLWIMEDKVGTALPDPEDKLVRVGTFQKQGDALTLDASLGSDAFADFELSYVIVTRTGKNPMEERVLVGTTTLFHALYRSAQRGQFGVIRNAQPETPVAEQGWFESLVDMVFPTAHADLGPIPNPTTTLQQMITRGRNTFFNQTFNGNGRTCGTCHREDDSLTISTDFMAGLPPDDPLFVAEFIPALALNFENPTLMRKFGLILENVDGFDNLPTKFVMRGIPHTLALNANTLKPALVDGTQGQFGGPPSPTTPIVPGTDPSIRERTGWSGDGAPGTGTLREFLLGAITQHYPRTLGRVVGVDFRLATNQELLDTEAFMKSTGRRKDLNLGGFLAQALTDPVLSLKDPVAREGQRIFSNPGNVPGIIPGSNEGAGKCLLCHAGGGAGDAVEQLLFAQASAIGNANFNTGVEDLPSHPANLVVAAAKNPRDGGFGRAPNPQGGFGDGTFNVPVLIEAADTAGFFHDNAVDSIEAAVAFYQGPAFNNSPAGQLAGGITLDGTEVEAIAKFLRVINALENVRSSIDLQKRAKIATSFSQAQELLKISIAELEDAFNVLKCGNLHLDARKELLEAIGIDVLALVTSNTALRNALIDEAIQQKNNAVKFMRN